jgi:hypothetical protein
LPTITAYRLRSDIAETQTAVPSVTTATRIMPPRELKTFPVSLWISGTAERRPVYRPRIRPPCF